MVACLLGPLPGPIQATPAAEAFALLQFLLHVDDAPGRTFFSDCAWVVDSFAGGPSASARAQHAHADIWRQIWAAHDARVYSIVVTKVKAHAKVSDLTSGYPLRLKEGNSFADAGAKEGRSMHPSDSALELEVARSFLLVTLVAKFLARAMEVAMRAADDVPALDRRAARSIGRGAAPLCARPLVHAAVIDGDRYRCAWCLRSAASKAALEASPCSATNQHVLWKAGGIVICRKCGCYSGSRVVRLSGDCIWRRGKRARWNIHRVFVKGLHPNNPAPVEAPTFWRRSQPFAEAVQIWCKIWPDGASEVLRLGTPTGGRKHDLRE